ncbi:MAG TPA: triose-phosphate isomerase [Gemmatimonadales bacterium]|jgi:triosephosphate isomerase
MTRPLLFAANWKMHIAPGEARLFIDRFLSLDTPRAGRTVAFFPPAVSIDATAQALHGHPHLLTGVQDVYWEPSGAFTGQVSVPLARAAGASAALVGHSECRHLFGETDAETNLKMAAVVAGGLLAVLCVGEMILERERDETVAVVTRQLRAALAGIPRTADLVVAYEPVWAIGTGRNATPSDAALVHVAIRSVLVDLGFSRDTRVLYGGSVKAGNAAALLSEIEIDGLLVGGASLDPEVWATICAMG